MHCSARAAPGPAPLCGAAGTSCPSSLSGRPSCARGCPCGARPATFSKGRASSRRCSAASRTSRAPFLICGGGPAAATASRRWRGPSTPSTQDRRQDAASHVIQRVRQPDVVVQLHIYLCGLIPFTRRVDPRDHEDAIAATPAGSSSISTLSQHQIAELRKVDVTTSIFIRPPEEVVHTIII